MAGRTQRRLSLLPPGARVGAPRRPVGVDSPAVEAIWNVVGAIPRGRVASYGAIAEAAGLPGRARLTGFALREAPPESHLPWHRVLGAGGRISFAPGSSHAGLQARLLRAEGVEVKNRRVSAAVLLSVAELQAL